MAKFISRRSDWVFASIALFLFAVLVGYAMYTISFIATRINEVLDQGAGGGQLIETFNFDKLNQLIGNTAPRI